MKKNENIKNDTTTSAKESRKPSCFEVLSPKEVKGYPKLKFVLNNFAKSKCVISVGRRSVATVPLVDSSADGNIDLGQVMPRLETVANANSIGKLQISLNDEIFKILTINKFKDILNECLTKLCVALTPKLIIITDTNEKNNLLKKYHDEPVTGGHAGTRRLTEKLKQKYQWKFMFKDISNYVKNCITCKKNKSLMKNKEKLTITKTPQNAFDVVIIDTIGPFVKSINGFEYAITIICDLTKYLVTVPITNKSARATATAIFENFILIYGPMKRIITDMGAEYKNATIKELCKIMKIEQVTSTAHHHQTVGTVERSHRTFNEYIRSYLATSKTDWDVWLSYFTYCFNTTPSTVHGYCPFELVFGKKPNKFRISFTKSNRSDLQCRSLRQGGEIPIANG